MTALAIVPKTATALADSTSPEVLHLQAAAENALASALRLIRALDCTPAQLRAATGRAARAAAALRQLSSRVSQS